MTEIIAMFKVNKIPDDMHGEDIRDFLINIGEKGSMDLISWGTIQMATIKVSILQNERIFQIYDNDAKLIIDLCHRLQSLDNYEINEEANQ